MRGHSTLDTYVSRLIFRRDSVKNFAKTRIAPERIEDRVYFDLEREPIALLRCLCQPGERLFVVPQSHISHKVMPRRNVVATRGFLFQSLQLFLGESADSGFESRCGESLFENLRLLGFTTQI